MHTNTHTQTENEREWKRRREQPTTQPYTHRHGLWTIQKDEEEEKEEAEEKKRRRRKTSKEHAISLEYPVLEPSNNNNKINMATMFNWCSNNDRIIQNDKCQLFVVCF